MRTISKTATKAVTNTKLAIATLMLFVAGGMALASLPLGRAGFVQKYDLDVEAVGLLVRPLGMDSLVSTTGTVSSTKTFRNNGRLDTGLFSVSTYYETCYEYSGSRIVGHGELRYLSSIIPVTNLSPGEQRTVTVTNTVSTAITGPDMCAYLLAVDGSNMLKEGLENNNNYWVGTIPHFNSGFQADFGVRNLQKSYLNPTQTKVTFDVVNYGEVDLRGDMPVGLERKTTSGVYNRLFSTSINTLPAGRQITVTYTMSTTPPTGLTNQLRAVVNKSKIINDISYHNNVVTSPFNWGDVNSVF